ncbi:MAG: glycoside hydrolase family 3 N-terminal domain-containing protein [Myxococcota bacterium]
MGLPWLAAASPWVAPNPVDALLMAAPPAAPIDAQPAVVLLQAWVFRNPQQAKAELERLAHNLPNAPLLACDLEGGRVNPLRCFSRLHAMPPAARMGLSDPAQTRGWGARAGQQLRELGLGLNLGPVVDVGADGHLARQFRLYSDDPARVVAHARAYVDGLGGEGVGAILKHFPGQGRAVTDPDRVATVIDATASELRTDQALFRQVPAAGIMLSNATYPSFDPRPAPQAPSIVSLARRFTRGVVMTDDLARLGRSAIDEAVLRDAFIAGADLLVTSVRLDHVLPTFRRVVGRLLEQRPALWSRVEASATRIAALQAR